MEHEITNYHFHEMASVIIGHHEITYIKALIQYLDKVHIKCDVLKDIVERYDKDVDRIASQYNYGKPCDYRVGYDDSGNMKDKTEIIEFDDNINPVKIMDDAWSNVVTHPKHNDKDMTYEERIKEINKSEEESLRDINGRKIY